MQRINHKREHILLASELMESLPCNKKECLSEVRRAVLDVIANGVVVMVFLAVQCLATR